MDSVKVNTLYYILTLPVYVGYKLHGTYLHTYKVIYYINKHSLSVTSARTNLVLYISEEEKKIALKIKLLTLLTCLSVL